MHRVLLLAGLTACSLASDIANKAVLATQRNDDLVQAVKNGQFNAMVSLLAEGTDKNFQEDSTGSSLLSLAAQENQLQIVKHLLEIGASVHTRDSNGGTALFGPATNGFTECTEILIKGGIDVNALDSTKFSALHYASFRGRTQIVDILLDNNADHTVMSSLQMTPFMLACQDGSCEEGNGKGRQWIPGYLGDRLHCDGMEGKKIDCSPKPKDVKPTHVETTEEVVADGEEDIRDVDVVNLENLQEEQNQAGGEVAASDEL